MKKTNRSKDAEGIAKELKSYRIQYAEIYNEIFDHLVSAVADKRAEGDEREVGILFGETMESVFGNRQQVQWLAEDREYALKGQLKGAFREKFKNYFNSPKAFVVIGIALFAFVIGTIFQSGVYILVFAALLTAVTPFLYMVGAVLRHGYRGRGSKRPTRSLAHDVMVGIGAPYYITMSTGFLLDPILKGLFGVQVYGGTSGGRLISLLGVPGFSIILAVAVVFTLSFIHVVNSDYRKLIQHAGTQGT